MQALNLRFLSPHRQLREFYVLTLIDEDAAVSQHKLAESVGLSPAMVNNYIKEFISQGLVVARGTNNRSTRYYLTDKGRALKQERLSLYLEEVFDLYDSAHREMFARLEELARKGARRLVLYSFPENSRPAVAAAAGRLGMEIVDDRDGAPEDRARLADICDALVMWNGASPSNGDLPAAGKTASPVRVEILF